METVRREAVVEQSASPRPRTSDPFDHFWTRLALVPIVAASGFAGLGYEIVWTRALSLALGTEMMAVLGVIAGFFGGLAVGAFMLDGAIRRTRSPYIFYAVLECMIGVWGLVSIWLLPLVARALPPWLGSEPHPTILWAASFALPAITLLPATIAMGGTLAGLERMIVAATRGSRVSAAVYGANTAGAVAGTLISTFILLPSLGLSRTLTCLAAINFCCALASFGIGRTSEPIEPPVDQARGWPVICSLTLTLLITGLFGIAYEVLVVRLAAQVLQDTVYTFAALLAAYLMGTAAGSLLWQRFGKSGDAGNLSLLCSSAASAGLITAALIAVFARYAGDIPDPGIAGELAIAMALFFLPSAAMGALFAFLAQQVRDQRGTLGWAVGINSLGACLAPLVTAQVLIPAIGAWTSLLLVSLAYLLLFRPSRRALFWAAAPMLTAATLFMLPSPQLTCVPPGGQLLSQREGPMVTASVVDDAAGTRYLEINGRFRMGGTSSQRSDYRQAVLPLLLHEAPKRSLFLGLGTGATFIGGALMPDVSVQGVELSSEVVALLPWFVNSKSGAMPPVITADARRYVLADTKHYDTIVADLFHPALDGSGALYTVEHFAAVKARLAPGGEFCQWLPLYQLDLPSLKAIIRSFLDVFPGGTAWLNHYSVRTPMLALVGFESTRGFDVRALANRLDSPAISQVVRPLGFEGDMDVLGQFIGGPKALSAFAGAGPRNTDDFPFVIFDAHRNVRALTAPPWTTLLAVIDGVKSDPAELLSGANTEGLGGRLAAYWNARNLFLAAGAALPGDPRGLDLVRAAAPGLLAAIRVSPEFNPAYAPLLAMAKTLLARDRAAARDLLNDLIAAAPARNEARDMMASAFAQ